MYIHVCTYVYVHMYVYIFIKTDAHKIIMAKTDLINMSTDNMTEVMKVNDNVLSGARQCRKFIPNIPSPRVLI